MRLLLLIVAVLSTGEDLLSQTISLTQSSDNICPGEELTLICETNKTEIQILRWTVDFPSEDITSFRNNIPTEGSIPPESFNRLINHSAVTFTFYRTSDVNTHPLVTELVISRVNIGINGTEISCSNTVLTDRCTTIIHVIDANPTAPNINKTVLEFNETNFTVILELTPEDDVTYIAGIVPFAELVLIKNHTWQLIGNYNTSYNVSIVATLCEKYSTTTIVILEYACTPPSPPPNGYINFHSSKSSITFVCQNSTIAEEVHIISRCNAFGKWVPNPTEFCSGGKQSSDINILIIGSSVSCFFLSFVICLLLLGCCCCHSTRYKNEQTVETNSMVENDGTVPIYEDLLPSVTIKSTENELKLKENVAYNSVEIRWQSNNSPA